MGDLPNNGSGTGSDDSKGVIASHPARAAQPFLVAPTTENAFNTVELDLVAVACMSLYDMLFDFDSSVLHPDVAGLLGQLAGLRERHRTRGQLPVLSIFGHADPVGQDEYNKQLSGRRARAVYGLLTHNIPMWDALYQEEWSHTDVLARLAERSQTSRQQGRDAIFSQYMQMLFPVPLVKSDFLGRGQGANGKADYQGCSDFNPLVVLSTEENATFSKAVRDMKNQPDRRVVIYMFCPPRPINPQLWPCPAATESTAGCRKRFFAGPTPGDRRRKPGPVHKEYAITKDTFACRFYDRIARPSPCESPSPVAVAFYELIVMDELETPLAGVEIHMTTPAGAITASTDDAGSVRVDDAPTGLGEASIGSLEQLAIVMAGQEKKPRRTAPLPAGSEFAIRVTRQVLNPVPLLANITRKLMIVSRTDVTLPWTEHDGYDQPRLYDSNGPWVLAQDPKPVLQLHSNGLGKIAVVIGPSPKSREFASIPGVPAAAEAAAPDPDGPDWVRVDVDALHQALFEKNSNAALDAIQSLHPGSAPPLEPQWPAPAQEAHVFSVALNDASAGAGSNDADFQGTGQALV